MQGTMYAVAPNIALGGVSSSSHVEMAINCDRSVLKLQLPLAFKAQEKYQNVFKWSGVSTR